MMARPCNSSLLHLQLILGTVRKGLNVLKLTISWTRVRVPTRIKNGSARESHVTIDTAPDVPCISYKSITNHATLKKANISPIPHSEINFKSAKSLPLEISGYIRFDLILDRKPCLWKP